MKVEINNKTYEVQSSGESFVLRYLVEKGIEFEQEKSFSDLVGDCGFPLRFDFYVKGKNRCFLIEVDGTQHRKQKQYSSEKLKRYDRMKDEYCKINGIQLYRLKYMTGLTRYLKGDMKYIEGREF